MTRLAPLRRPLAALARAAVILVVALSCRGKDPAGPADPLLGVYSVVKVNVDETAPYLVFVQNLGGVLFRMEVLDGTLTLRPDRTYTNTLTTRIQITGDPDEVTTETEVGTYAVIGNVIALDPSSAGQPTHTARRDSTDLTFSRPDGFGGVFGVTARK